MKRWNDCCDPHSASLVRVELLRYPVQTRATCLQVAVNCL